MKYNILTNNRKVVKTKLEELTGKKAVYAGTPSFAFILDGITIGRDCVVEAGEEYAGVLQQLVEDGILKAIEDSENDNEAEDETLATESCGQESDVPDNQPESEEPDAGESEQETIENDDQEELLTSSEAKTASSESPQENVKVEAQDNHAGNGNSEPLKAEFSFPLSQHRPESICNLIFTIYSKGSLLSKSTGGDFYISDELKDVLKAGNFKQNVEVISVLKEAGTEDLRGLSFSDTTYSFTGFPETEDTEKIRAWMKLSAAIHQAAIRQKRIQPKRSDEANEKFAFRTWLTRIGMNGPDLKAERQIYYQNLSGHTAFRTQADADRWKKRQAEKRMELKAEVEADSSGSVIESDEEGTEAEA